MHYTDIGHEGDWKQTELWWWIGDNPGHIHRATPLPNKHREFGTYYHSDIIDGTTQHQARYSRNGYAQGRIDHENLEISFVTQYVQSLLYQQRLLLMLKKQFPGYKIHEFD